MDTFWQEVTKPQALSALKLTLGVSFLVAAFNALTGTAIAWVLVRDSFPGKGFFKDRKSTRLNSSHSQISYAVFCLKKKKHLVKPHLRTRLRQSFGFSNAVTDSCTYLSQSIELPPSRSVAEPARDHACVALAAAQS